VESLWLSFPSCGLELGVLWLVGPSEARPCKQLAVGRQLPIPWPDCPVGNHSDYVHMAVLVVVDMVVVGHVRL
jgi:hypothetical protein